MQMHADKRGFFYLCQSVFFYLKTKVLSNRFLISVVLLGLLIRLLLMPFTLHIDPRFTGDIATFPSAVQVWNSPERASRTFLYPPLFYHTLSAYLRLIQSFVPQLLTMPISGPEAQFNWLSSPLVFRYLLVLKAWYLLPDLAIAFLLWRLWRREPAKARAGLFSLWR
jgi:hypothetical protein